MEPQNKTAKKTSCLGYFDNPVIVELVSGSFGDDDQSLRIFNTFLAGETPEDPDNVLPFAKRYPFMKRFADPRLAALKGRFSVVKWLVPLVDVIGCEYLGTEIIRKAAEGGHLEILRWLVENWCSWDSQTCCLAAENGHLHCLKFLARRDYKCFLDKYGSDICVAAARKGHLDCIKWADENGCKWYYRTVCAAAAYGGQLECLKWALGQEPRGKFGKAEVWVLDPEICHSAAEGGSLECLQFARESGCYWDEGTCHILASEGNLDCLKWACENGCPIHDSICSTVASYGHLHCLKWARENGCPWDENTCRFAAANGHQDCLQWARENGCPES